MIDYVKKNISVFKLDNGFNLVTYVPKTKSSIGYACLKIKVGSFYETTENHGISHLIEHIILDQNRYLTSEQNIRDETSRLNTTLKGQTTPFFTTYNISFLNNHFEESMKFFYKLIFNSFFTPYINKIHFEKILSNQKRIVEQEYLNSRDDPVYRAYIKAEKFMWDKNKSKMYSQDVIGYPNSNKISLNQLESFYQKFYVANNVSMVISIPPTNKKSINQQLTVIFGSTINNHNQTQKIKFSNLQLPKNKTIYVAEDLSQIHFRLNFYIHTSDKDNLNYSLKLALLGELLANSKESILFEILRNKNQFVYTVNSDFYLFENRGFLNISFSTSKENFAKAIKLILKELLLIKKTGISLKYFAKLKKNIKISQFFRQKSASYIVKFIASYLAENKGVVTPYEFQKLLLSIPKKEVDALTKKVFNFKNMLLIAYGPKEFQKEIEKLKF